MGLQLCENGEKSLEIINVFIKIPFHSLTIYFLGGEFHSKESEKREDSANILLAQSGILITKESRLAGFKRILPIMEIARKSVDLPAKAKMFVI